MGCVDKSYVVLSLGANSKSAQRKEVSEHIFEKQFSILILRILIVVQIRGF